LTASERRYVDDIERRLRHLSTEVRLRTFTIQAMWLLVVLAGAGIPLSRALGGPSWLEPTLGFVVVAAAGIERIFARTSEKAAAIDELRRALAHEHRTMLAGTGEYVDESTAFATFAARCEAAIADHDRRSVEEDRRLLAAG
jgi:hypothetical protein